MTCADLSSFLFVEKYVCALHECHDLVYIAVIRYNVEVKGFIWLIHPDHRLSLKKAKAGSPAGQEPGGRC